MEILIWKVAWSEIVWSARPVNAAKFQWKKVKKSLEDTPNISRKWRLIWCRPDGKTGKCCEVPVFRRISQIQFFLLSTDSNFYKFPNFADTDVIRLGTSKNYKKVRGLRRVFCQNTTKSQTPDYPNTGLLRALTAVNINIRYQMGLQNTRPRTPVLPNYRGKNISWQKGPTLYSMKTGLLSFFDWKNDGFFLDQNIGQNSFSTEKN